MSKLTRDTQQTIAATSTIIAEALYAPNYREVLILRNVSTLGEVISIAVGTAAVAQNGIVLNPNDSVTFAIDGAYTPSNDRFNAIGSAATAKLAIHEEMNVRD